MKRMVREELAQSTTEFAIVAAVVFLGLVSVLALCSNELTASLSGWIVRSIGSLSVLVKDKGDLAPVVEELWLF